MFVCYLTFVVDLNTPNQPRKRSSLALYHRCRFLLPTSPLLVTLGLCPVDQLAHPKPRKGPTAPGEWTGSMPLSLCQASPTVEGVSGYLYVIFWFLGSYIIITKPVSGIWGKVSGTDIILAEITAAWFQLRILSNCGDNNQMSQCAEASVLESYTWQLGELQLNTLCNSDCGWLHSCARVTAKMKPERIKNRWACKLMKVVLASHNLVDLFINVYKDLYFAYIICCCPHSTW